MKIFQDAHTYILEGAIRIRWFLIVVLTIDSLISIKKARHPKTLLKLQEALLHATNRLKGHLANLDILKRLTKPLFDAFTAQVHYFKKYDSI